MEINFKVEKFRIELKVCLWRFSLTIGAGFTPLKYDLWDNKAQRCVRSAFVFETSYTYPKGKD